MIKKELNKISKLDTYDMFYGYKKLDENFLIYDKIPSEGSEYIINSESKVQQLLYEYKKERIYHFEILKLLSGSMKIKDDISDEKIDIIELLLSRMEEINGIEMLRKENDSLLNINELNYIYYISTLPNVYSRGIFLLYFLLDFELKNNEIEQFIPIINKNYFPVIEDLFLFHLFDGKEINYDSLIEVKDKLESYVEKNYKHLTNNFYKEYIEYKFGIKSQKSINPIWDYECLDKTGKYRFADIIHKISIKSPRYHSREH